MDFHARDGHIGMEFWALTRKRCSISRFKQLAIFLLLHYTRAAWADRLVCIGRIWIPILGIDLEVLHGFTLHHRDTTSSMAGNVFLQLQSRGTFIPRKRMGYISSA